jgi:hypothetical protein
VYVSYGSGPQAAALLYGVKPATIAIVVQALYSLGRTAIRSRWLAVVAIAAGVTELAFLFGTGFICPPDDPVCTCAVAHRHHAPARVMNILPHFVHVIAPGGALVKTAGYLTGATEVIGDNNGCRDKYSPRENDSSGIFTQGLLVRRSRDGPLR